MKNNLFTHPLNLSQQCESVDDVDSLSQKITYKIPNVNEFTAYRPHLIFCDIWLSKTPHALPLHWLLLPCTCLTVYFVHVAIDECIIATMQGFWCQTRWCINLGPFVFFEFEDTILIIYIMQKSKKKSIRVFVSSEKITTLFRRRLANGCRQRQLRLRFRLVRYSTSNRL